MFSHYFLPNDNELTKNINIIFEKNYKTWLENSNSITKNILKNQNFEPQAGNFHIFLDKLGDVESVVAICNEYSLESNLANLASKLPAEYNYKINNHEQFDEFQLNDIFIGWALANYNFQKYKTKTKNIFLPKLVTLQELNLKKTFIIIEAIFLIRDLVNMPASDLNPRELANQIIEVAENLNVNYNIYSDEQLQIGWGAVYAIGKSSKNKPYILDLKHNYNSNYPLITIVGKGVCYDTGGYNLKPSDPLKLMKKDMGGAAHSLAIFQAIAKLQLPIALRLIIPCVENMISSNSIKPSDIITSRSGKTIEVLNTDAEGRLILADALFEASQEKPNLIIDFATLTGAARVALGQKIVPFFSNSEIWCENLKNANKPFINENIWQLPLFKPYQKSLKSNIADIANIGKSGAGAINAALFLQEFITQNIPWIHFDIFAWNENDEPGNPIGGTAFAIKTIINMMEKFTEDKSE